MWPCTDTHLGKGQLLVFRELQIFLFDTIPKTQEVEKASSRLTKGGIETIIHFMYSAILKFTQFIFDLCIVLNHSLTI